MGSCFGKKEYSKEMKYTQPQINFEYKYNGIYYFFNDTEQYPQNPNARFWIQYM